MRRIFFIFCFSLLITALFGQGEKINGDPKFDFYTLPDNILVKNLDTLYMCPNQPLQLVLVDKGGVTKCNVSYWTKNGVYVLNSMSSNTLTIVDTGVYSPYLICGPYTGAAISFVVRRRLSIYKLPENIPLSFSYNSLNLCANDSFQLKLIEDSIAIPCTYYQWKKNGEIIPHNNTNVYTITGPGSYNVSLICSACGNITLGNYDVACPASITTSLNPDLILFPNPANEKLFIQLDSVENTAITFYDPIGKVILFKKLEEKSSEINISSLANGIYYISVDTKTNSSKQKIIINH